MPTTTTTTPTIPDETTTTPDETTVPTTTTYPNQAIPITLVLIITAIFFVFKYKKEDIRLVSFIIYCLVLILSQLFLNLNLTNAVCGTNKWATTIFVTFIPWLLIFGSLYFILMKFPGWLKPFSNTFGYWVVSAIGLKDVFSNILQPATRDGDVLAKIYNITANQSLLINEIPSSPEGFQNFIDFLREKELIPTDESGEPDKTDESESIKQLRKLIRLKNIVAEFIWYSLTGVLTTLVSYNYIIKTEC